jgi:hypothetical protein
MTGYRYAIMRFVPDASRQEFMNVGVVVTSDNADPIVRVLPAAESHSRAKCLGYAGDLKFLQAIERNVHSWGSAAQANLSEASHEWGGTIRFSDLHGALHDDPADLCNELFDRYVALPTSSRRSSSERDRHFARRVVRDSLRARLPGESVKATPLVPGKVEQHRFDVGIQNGQLLHAVAALSFDIKTERLLAAEVDACAWAIADVRDADGTLPISVITVGNSQRKLLARAESVYDQLGAKVVSEAQIHDWAVGLGAEVGPKLRQSRTPAT